MKKKFFYSLILIAGLVLGGSSVNRVYSQAQKSDTTKQVVKKGNTKSTMHHDQGSTMMKQNQMNQMNDSSTMKKGHMMNHSTMMNDSSKMKQGHMMNDSSTMKQGHMMKDSTSMRGGMMGK